MEGISEGTFFGKAIKEVQVFDDKSGCNLIKVAEKYRAWAIFETGIAAVEKVFDWRAFQREHFPEKL